MRERNKTMPITDYQQTFYEEFVAHFIKEFDHILQVLNGYGELPKDFADNISSLFASAVRLLPCADQALDVANLLTDGLAEVLESTSSTLDNTGSVISTANGYLKNRKIIAYRELTQEIANKELRVIVEEAGRNVIRRFAFIINEKLANKEVVKCLARTAVERIFEYLSHEQHCDIRLLEGETHKDSFLIDVLLQNEILIIKREDSYLIRFKNKRNKKGEYIANEGTDLYEKIEKMNDLFSKKGILLRESTDEASLKSIWNRLLKAKNNNEQHKPESEQENVRKDFFEAIYDCVKAEKGYTNKKLAFTVENLLNGVSFGKSGRFIKSLTNNNVEFKSEVESKSKTTAEGIFSRCGFVTQRHIACAFYQSEYSTNEKKEDSNERSDNLKYNYALVPSSFVENSLEYKEVSPTDADEKKWYKQKFQSYTIEPEEIYTYLIEMAAKKEEDRVPLNKYILNTLQKTSVYEAESVWVVFHGILSPTDPVCPWELIKFGYLDLSMGIFSNVDFSGVKIEKTKIKSFKNSYLTGAELKNVDASEANLQGVNLVNVIATETNFSGAKFLGAKIQLSIFTKCQITETRLVDVEGNQFNECIESSSNAVNTGLFKLFKQKETAINENDQLPKILAELCQKIHLWANAIQQRENTLSNSLSKICEVLSKAIEVTDAKQIEDLPVNQVSHDASAQGMEIGQALAIAKILQDRRSLFKENYANYTAAIKAGNEETLSQVLRNTLNINEEISNRQNIYDLFVSENNIFQKLYDGKQWEALYEFYQIRIKAYEQAFENIDPNLEVIKSAKTKLEDLNSSFEQKIYKIEQIQIAVARHDELPNNLEEQCRLVSKRIKTIEERENELENDLSKIGENISKVIENVDAKEIGDSLNDIGQRCSEWDTEAKVQSLDIETTWVITKILLNRKKNINEGYNQYINAREIRSEPRVPDSLLQNSNDANEGSNENQEIKKHKEEIYNLFSLENAIYQELSSNKQWESLEFFYKLRIKTYEQAFEGFENIQPNLEVIKNAKSKLEDLKTRFNEKAEEKRQIDLALEENNKVPEILEKQNNLFFEMAKRIKARENDLKDTLPKVWKTMSDAIENQSLEDINLLLEQSLSEKCTRWAKLAFKQEIDIKQAQAIKNLLSDRMENIKLNYEHYKNALLKANKVGMFMFSVLESKGLFYDPSLKGLQHKDAIDDLFSTENAIHQSLVNKEQWIAISFFYQLRIKRYEQALENIRAHMEEICKVKADFEILREQFDHETRDACIDIETYEIYKVKSEQEDNLLHHAIRVKRQDAVEVFENMKYIELFIYPNNAGETALALAAESGIISIQEFIAKTYLTAIVDKRKTLPDDRENYKDLENLMNLNMQLKSHLDKYRDKLIKRKKDIVKYETITSIIGALVNRRQGSLKWYVFDRHYSDHIEARAASYTELLQVLLELNNEFNFEDFSKKESSLSENAPRGERNKSELFDPIDAKINGSNLSERLAFLDQQRAQYKLKQANEKVKKLEQRDADTKKQAFEDKIRSEMINQQNQSIPEQLTNKDKQSENNAEQSKNKDKQSKNNAKLLQGLNSAISNQQSKSNNAKQHNYTNALMNFNL